MLILHRIIKIVTLSIILVHSVSVMVTLNCVEVTMEKDIFPKSYPERSFTSSPVSRRRYMFEAMAGTSYLSPSSDSGIQKAHYEDPFSYSCIPKLQQPNPGNTKCGREWYYVTSL